jgi:tripartite-type tricarboxylate transporter receptor subunit TctC
MTTFFAKETGGARIMRTGSNNRHVGPSRRRLLVGAIALSTGSKALADEYPNRPIRLVVPFGAGSIADIVARRTSEVAKAALGQTIYIENRPGAAGSIGANVVAKSAPDGYTLCLGTVASHSIAAATVATLPYDPIADFIPLALLINAWSSLAVNKEVPAKTLPEYFEFARKKGFSPYVSGGVGTTTHLLVELMRVREQLPLQHIPVANVGNAFSDLLAGNVDMMSYPVLALRPHIHSGAARPLAVASAKRVPILPEVPTVVEILKSSEYDLRSWFGLFAPAKTPAAIVARVSTAFTDAIKSMSADMEALGAEAVGWGPEQFDPFFRAELPRWREVVRLTGTGPAK